MIRELLKQPSTTKIYANFLGWFTPAGGSHRAGVAQSDDPDTIRKQIEMAKAMGIDGFVFDFYGQGSQPSFEVIKIMAELLRYIPDFEFSVMLDSGIYKWASNDPVLRAKVLQDATTWVVQNFCGLPSYSRINGKPVLWEFGWRQNPISAAPDLGGALLLSQDSIMSPAAGTFGWVNGLPPNTPEQYMAGYLARADSLQVPCIFHGFDDHDPKNPANSIWPGAGGAPSPARFIDSKNGDTWTNCIQAINSTGKAYPAVQICTWNDYDERTCIEPIAKAMTGNKLL